MSPRHTPVLSLFCPPHLRGAGPSLASNPQVGPMGVRSSESSTAAKAVRCARCTEGPLPGRSRVARHHRRRHCSRRGTNSGEGRGQRLLTASCQCRPALPLIESKIPDLGTAGQRLRTCILPCRCFSDAGRGVAEGNKGWEGREGDKLVLPCPPFLLPATIIITFDNDSLPIGKTEPNSSCFYL